MKKRNIESTEKASTGRAVHSNLDSAEEHDSLNDEVPGTEDVFAPTMNGTPRLNIPPSADIGNGRHEKASLMDIHISPRILRQCFNSHSQKFCVLQFDLHF
jgi:hypothetical protein